MYKNKREEWAKTFRREFKLSKRQNEMVSDLLEKSPEKEAKKKCKCVCHKSYCKEYDSFCVGCMRNHTTTKNHKEELKGEINKLGYKHEFTGEQMRDIFELVIHSQAETYKDLVYKVREIVKEADIESEQRFLSKGEIWSKKYLVDRDIILTKIKNINENI